MSPEIQVPLRLNTPQFRARKAFVGASRRTLVLAWGRGVGKSFFLRTLWWELVAQYDGKQRDALAPFKGVRIVVLMPTLKQFKAVHLNDIINELEGTWSFLRGKVDKQSGEITFPGGSWIRPVPASAHNSQTARGLRCDLLCVDEADDVSKDVYDSVAVPWLSATWSLGLQVLSGTPRRGRHGLLFRQYNYGRKGKRLRVGETLPGLEPFQTEQYRKIYTFHATYSDVPEIVAPEAVALARATSIASVFAREWKCDFDAGEGLVYGGAFDERFHVRAPPANVAWTEILIGCDHGYEDPGVFLLIGVIGSGRDAICWVIDEVYEQHKLETWWKKKLKEWLDWYPNAKFYGDPSLPSRLEAYRTECRARVQEVDNSIEDGVSAVADRFLEQVVIVTDEDGNPVLDENGEAKVLKRFARLYIAPKCVNLIRELGLYKRKADPKDPDRYTDEIVDRDNHAPDALRYAVFNRFGGPDRRPAGAPHEALG